MGLGPRNDSRHFQDFSPQKDVQEDSRKDAGSLLPPVQEAASCANGSTPLHRLGPSPLVSVLQSQKEQLRRIFGSRERALGRPGPHTESRGALSDGYSTVAALVSDHMRG